METFTARKSFLFLANFLEFPVVWLGLGAENRGVPQWSLPGSGCKQGRPSPVFLLYGESSIH